MVDSFIRETDLGQGRKRFERVIVVTYNVYKSGANQTITAGPTIVVIDAERNAANGLSLSSNQVQITDVDLVGKYEINACVSGRLALDVPGSFHRNVTASRRNRRAPLAIKKNNTELMKNIATSSIA